MTYRNIIAKLEIFAQKHPELLDMEAIVYAPNNNGSVEIDGLCVLDKGRNPMFYEGQRFPHPDMEMVE